MSIADLTRLDEPTARAMIEGIRWPHGARCAHCNSVKVAKLGGAAGDKGQYKCRDCHKKFTVRVGTIFEDSPLPLRHWVYAFARMCASKKGISAHQLHRELGITYKSAWFMCHRIRHAMEETGGILGGDGGAVEVDETYVGGKPRKNPFAPRGPINPLAWRWPRSTKTPVVALVERGGKARARVMERPTGPEIKAYMRRNIKRESLIMTDESKLYTGTQALFQGHETVNHSQFEYKRGNASTNEVEAFFALIKRAHYGTHHHYSKAHIDSYITEAAFKWNTRKIDCVERTKAAIAGARGKRLTYRRTD